MPRTVLEAIQLGEWDFEPESCDEGEFDATSAMPGSNAKVVIMSQRLQRGQPLWHPADRRWYDDSEF